MCGDVTKSVRTVAGKWREKVGLPALSFVQAPLLGYNVGAGRYFHVMSK